MANLNMVFDASQVEPSSPRETLPPGKYPAHIVASEMKATSKGGQMLVLEFEVLEGEHESRKLWARLNLDNPNPKAVEIAQRELSAICRATGQITVSDSEALHFKPVLLTVKVEAPRPKPDGSGDYPAQNSIAGYEPHTRAAGGFATRPAAVAARPAAPAQAAPVAAGATTTAAPPWKRQAAA